MQGASTRHSMQRMSLLKRLVAPALGGGEEGQDMIEYALLAALISIVAIAMILLVGPYLDNLFSDVVNVINLA